MANDREKRPNYPKRRTCNCKKRTSNYRKEINAEPEWEWQEEEDIWTCLGCGMTIEGKSGKKLFE